MTFGKNLKKARESKGWTQSKTALKTGVHRHNIGAYEENRANPSLEAFVKICKGFGIKDISFADDPNFKLN